MQFSIIVRFMMVITCSVLFCSTILILEDYSETQYSREILLNSNTDFEMRGVWLNDYAFDSPEKRYETLKKIDDANLNTIFLSAPPPIGENNGWSDVDDFEAMLTLAKQMNLIVHAWVCNMYRLNGKYADFQNETERIAQKN